MFSQKVFKWEKKMNNLQTLHCELINNYFYEELMKICIPISLTLTVKE